MSVYGYLACMDCKVVLWLGKVSRLDDTFTRIHSFDNLFYPSKYPSHVPPALHEGQLRYTYALHKMLTEHPRHNLRVIIEGDPEEQVFADDADYVQIGGDRVGDISLDTYLADWLGHASP